MAQRAIVSITACFILAAMACGGRRSGDTGGWTVSDSAGIRIAHNQRPAWPASGGWQLSAEPVVRIGGVDAGEPYELYRVTAAQMLSDGRIVVANSGTQELRFYDAAGRYLSRAGGNGEGPGEFRSIIGLQVAAGDTILVYDGSLARITYFDPEGSLARTTRVTGERSGPAMAFQLLRDGSLVVVTGVAFTINSPDGYSRPDFTLYRHPPNGSDPEALGTWPGVGAWARTPERSVQLWYVPFAGSTLFAADTGSIFAALQDPGEIHRLDSSGRLTAVIRADWERTAITDAIREEYIAGRLEGIHDAGFRRRSAAAYREMPIPEYAPVFELLLLDDLGSLWVRRFSHPGADVERWDVFGPDGRWLGPLSFPAGFRPTQIGADFVLGRWQDDLEVEYVLRYELQRRGGEVAGR
jgi:hypothetical protein